MDASSILLARQAGGAPLPAYGPYYGQLAPHARGALVTLIVFLILTLVFTGLRFYSRWISVRRFFASDWTYLVAQVIYIAYSTISFISLFRGGVGYHIYDLGTAQVQLILQLLLAVQITYALCMALLKVSICLLYVQIFPQRWVHVCSYTIMAFSAAWALQTILIGVLICRPISALWDPLSGTCGDQNAGYSSVSGVELIIDAAIILLPLPVVWKLNTNPYAKLAASSLFGLGVITIVVTGVRLHVLLNLDFADFSYTAIDLYNLTVAELGVAMIVTAGTCLRPMVETIFRRRLWNSKSGSAQGPTTGRSVTHKRDTFMMGNVGGSSMGRSMRTHEKLEESIDVDYDDETTRLGSYPKTSKSSAGSWTGSHGERPVGQAITVTNEVVIERESV